MRRKKKSILFFQSHNNIRCSNSCVRRSSYYFIVVFYWVAQMNVCFRLTFSYSVCLSLVSSSLFSIFLLHHNPGEKRPCLLSLTPSFTHSFDLRRNNIERTREEEQHPNIRLKMWLLITTSKKEFFSIYYRKPKPIVWLLYWYN
jgi:hypothetical protein